MGDNGLKIHEWMFKQKAFLKHLNLPGDGETGTDNDLVNNTIDRIGANIMGKNMFVEGVKPTGLKKLRSIARFMF